MFRRSNQNRFKLVSSGDVYEVRYKSVNEETKDGNIETRVTPSLVNVTSPDQDANIPDFADYTLTNLLAAGVPVRDVNCNLLNPSDPADLEIRGVDLAVRAVSSAEEVSTPSVEDPAASEPDTNPSN